jgi:2,4'-dihydroxyacetophenone dioxygenase
MPIATSTEKRLPDSFRIEGGLIYLDKPVNGGFGAFEDGFTALELTRKYYREAGLNLRQLDLLVR